MLKSRVPLVLILILSTWVRAFASLEGCAVGGELRALIDAPRLTRKQIQEQKRQERIAKDITNNFKRVNSRYFTKDGAPKPYAPGYYKFKNGTVVSKYRPTKAMPLGKIKMEPDEVLSGGSILKTSAEIKRYFKGKDFRDGTHVFLWARQASGEDWLVIANRIPENLDPADPKYVTHRSLKNRYREITGSEIVTAAGGETTIDIHRRMHNLIDRVGSNHFPHWFRPTSDYSADLFSASGGVRIDKHTKIKRFVPGLDPGGQEAGHLPAKEAARREAVARGRYSPQLPKVQRFAEKYLDVQDEFERVNPVVGKRIFDERVKANPIYKSRPELREVFTQFFKSGPFLKDGSSQAAYSLFHAVETDYFLKKNAARTLELLADPKIQDLYIREIKRGLAEVRP